MNKPKKVLLGENESVELDVDRLITTRLLVAAMSGGGKSFLLRRILEQTHGQLQHIVIDPEGEFYTLRDKYDYVLARPKGEGDCPAEPKSAGLLATSLLELGVSAILDIYELPPRDRVLFVKNFLTSLVNAPKRLWHPVLVVVDEANIFAPQDGDAESSSAVMNLMTLGRKRGFCGILACPRLSQLSKDAAAPCGNLLIGRNTLDVDVARAAKSLGFTPKDAPEKLRTLKDGEFYCFGSALTPEVTKTRIGPVITAHPKAGAAAPPPAPPRAAIQKVLAQLSEIPAEVERKAATEAELRRRISELELQVKKAAAAPAKQSPPVDPAPLIEKAVQAAVSRMRKEAAQKLTELSKQLAVYALTTIGKFDLFGDLGPSTVSAVQASSAAQFIPIRPSVSTALIERSAPRSTATGTQPSGKISGGKQRILIALAQRSDLSARQLGLRAGLSSSSGTFGTYLAALRSEGFIEGTKQSMKITQAGLGALGDYDPLPTGAELKRYWQNEIGAGSGASRMLEALSDAYPRSISKTELGERAGISSSSGTFGTYLAKLRTLELIVDRDGGIGISEELI